MNTRRDFLVNSLAGGALCSATAVAAEARYDVVVYGGTAGGVMAAVEAGRAGLKVVLIEPLAHIGGMTSGGLGATDYGKKESTSGLSREFYGRVKKYYLNDQPWKHEPRQGYKVHGHDWDEPVMWRFEPHVAEAILREMAAVAKVEILCGQRLDLKRGVRKTGRRIDSITMESGRVFTGRMFIDASYEGDLMAKAGVSYTVGREGVARYDEPQAGVRPRTWSKSDGGNSLGHFLRGVDPYIKTGVPSSGLLPGVTARKLPPAGSPDKGVQAYNFRLCLTDVAQNRLPFEKPRSYDAMNYELMLRLLTSEVKWPEFPELPAPEHPVLGWNPFTVIMPNRKTDTNTKGAVSSDYVGENWDYPDASHARRETIFTHHREYQQGMLWFIANDPRVPDAYRLPFQKWGLAKDEFTDSGGWPFQLYVREGRRMLGEYVMTQHDCQSRQVAQDPVGLGSYGLDSHFIQRYVDDRGFAQNEGHIFGGAKQPYPISYRSLTPRASEVENLLVPTCLSASHVAYCSIRMEPVYMVLGQSAGAAAVLALRNNTSVQRVDYAQLRKRLEEAGQALTWPLESTKG